MKIYCSNHLLHRIRWLMVQKKVTPISNQENGSSSFVFILYHNWPYYLKTSSATYTLNVLAQSMSSNSYNLVIAHLNYAKIFGLKNSYRTLLIGWKINWDFSCKELRSVGRLELYCVLISSLRESLLVGFLEMCRVKSTSLSFPFLIQSLLRFHESSRTLQDYHTFTQFFSMYFNNFHSNDSFSDDNIQRHMYSPTIFQQSYRKDWEVLYILIN